MLYTAVFSLTCMLSFVLAYNGDTEFRNVVVDTHNKYRIRHGEPELSWDWELAKYAEDWASECDYRHSPNGNRPYNDNVGENVSYGFTSMQAVIEDWYDTEVDSYDFERGESKNGVDILHLTQMIWKKTTRVGCAEAYCENLRGYFSVCNYYPRGNFENAYVQNVKPPIGSDM